MHNDRQNLNGMAAELLANLDELDMAEIEVAIAKNKAATAKRKLLDAVIRNGAYNLLSVKVGTLRRLAR